jgi:hypothetical protein
MCKYGEGSEVSAERDACLRSDLRLDAAVTFVKEGRCVRFTHEKKLGHEASMELYSVLLPTYNERENLPYIIWLLVQAFEKRFASSCALCRR